MELKTFENKDQLVSAVTAGLIQCIKESIEQYGDARILLSGGSTPGPVYRQLSNIDLEWDKVHIGLVDERFVISDNEFSNERLIKETLIQNSARMANVIGMVFNIEERENNRDLAEQRYQPFIERTDCTLLGMGGDGHTASLFPTDAASLADLNKSSVGIINTQAPVHPVNRISCSKALLLNSRKIAIMITGQNKLSVLNDNQLQLPIHRFIAERNTIQTYYAE